MKIVSYFISERFSALDIFFGALIGQAILRGHWVEAGLLFLLGGVLSRLCEIVVEAQK